MNVFNYVTVWERQNYRDDKKMSNCQMFSGKEGSVGEEKSFALHLSRFLDETLSVIKDRLIGEKQTSLITCIPPVYMGFTQEN